MNKFQQFVVSALGLKSLLPANASTSIAGGHFTLANGQIAWVADNSESYIVNGYQANDIIFSAVRMIMDKARVAPWGLYKVEDEQALKSYNAILSGKRMTQDFTELQKLRKKALVPYTTYNSRLGKLNDLMKWPNEFVPWNDFIADGIGFKLITGNKAIWANLLDGGANMGIPHELFNMPAQYIKVVATRSFPQRVVGYQLHSGEIKSFTIEEVMHEKFWNPAYDLNGSSLYGQSPILAASKTLTRNNAAKKAGSVQLQNNGAAGIVYMDDPIIASGERKSQASAIKGTWDKEYRGEESYGRVAFSGYKMGYVPVGSSLKDMDLTNIEAVDLRRLANIYNLPSQLLNDPENKTYNNQREAEKALTSRCALPHLISMRDMLNKKLQTHWGFKGVNVVVDFDISVYPELQEDQKDKWTWVKELPVSSAYKLEMMGLDVPDDPNLQVILVDQNLVPLSDAVNTLTDQQLNDINNELNKSGLLY